MPLPGIIAATVAAARAAAVTAKTVRTVGGIVGKGSKNVSPVYRNMDTPTPPPGGKTFNPNPPKPPTSSSMPKKEPHVSENRTPVQKLGEPSKEVSRKNPTKSKNQFSGDLARYNWTGK